MTFSVGLFGQQSVDLAPQPDVTLLNDDLEASVAIAAPFVLDGYEALLGGGVKGQEHARNALARYRGGRSPGRR